MAADLDASSTQLCDAFGLAVCFHDPGVGDFGLHNALMVVGDQFLEVVSPTEPGTTAGRLIDKRGGDGGYMAMYEVDDLDDRIDHLREHGVRIVWAGDFPTIRGRHLHPATSAARSSRSTSRCRPGVGRGAARTGGRTTTT